MSSKKNPAVPKRNTTGKRGSVTCLGLLGGIVGLEEKEWYYKPRGPILRICVWYDEKQIWGILFKSETRDGDVIGNPKQIGRNNEVGKNASGLPVKTGEVCIDNSQEQLIDSSQEQLEAISVEWDDFYLRSLTFQTNQNTYGPYGPTKFDGTTADSFQIEGRTIVEFRGWHASEKAYYTPTAIGVSVAPRGSSSHSNEDPDSRSTTAIGRSVAPRGSSSHSNEDLDSRSTKHKAGAGEEFIKKYGALIAFVAYVLHILFYGGADKR